MSAAKRDIAPGDEGRLLGGVKMAAQKAAKANAELERQVARAATMGCSYRAVATAAGFGSHHRVQEVLKRVGKDLAPSS